jgi:uncharacterized protein YecE (DUF72 family)
LAEVRIGTSGWLYAGWRGSFYPPGLPHRAELEYNASTFTSVEVNGSFYSLQRPESYQRWRETTPDDFVFAVKGGRFITHLKKLSDVETPLANFYASGVLALAHKLGPFLWQLPPSLGFDADRLERFFDLLPRSTSAAVELASRHDARIAPDRTSLKTDADRPLRHALEIRHASFATDTVTELLRRHDIAVVVVAKPIEGMAPAALPGAGSLSDLPRDQKFTSVGYGAYEVTRGPGGHQFLYNDVRMVATGTLNAINKSWLRISMNPATGDGGTCYGDSGGPNFLGRTDIVAATTITGDAICRATNVVYRTDTASARTFLADYVTLP